MVSNLERFDFSVFISGVMNGLCGRERKEVVLSGACLSRSEERVVVNCATYSISDVAGEV